MKPFFLNWDCHDLRRLAFAALALLFCVMYMGTFPTPRVSTSVSDTSQSAATYGVQGIIPWIANDSNQLLSKWEGQSKGSDGAAWWAYSYDANGNLTTGTQTNGKETFARYQYTWDVKNRLSRFVENETQRQRNGYEFESGLRYLKEDIRFTKQAPMFETVKQRTLYSDAGEEALRRNRNPADRIGRKKSAPRRRALSGM
jgi:YD repeat-containing protein